jgi:hypothetical protein
MKKNRPVTHKSLFPRLFSAALFSGVSLVMSACNNNAIPSQNVQSGPTNSIVAPEVMPLNSGIKIQSAVQADLIKVFDSAQKVHPPKTIGGASTPNGYTITFFDFYGVSFAYLHQVSRATTSLDPKVLAARHNPDTVVPAQEKNWVDGTYVTGANTRRTTMGSYTHGFPVLYGLYSQDSQKKGFRIADVTKFVMPVAGNYWVLTTSGRYFDLVAREWVDAKKLETFKQAYDSILGKLAQVDEYEATMTTYWKAFDQDLDVRPGECSASLTRSECVLQNAITPATLAPYCFTRWFMWWSWWDCSSTQGNFTADGQEYSTLLGDFTTISIEDNDQFRYPNSASPYSGCGPNAGKNLLKWWQTKKGIANALRPASGGFTSEQNTQIELINYMGAYVSGDGRAINSSGCGGMQQYLTNNSIPLTVLCAEGIWVTTGWFQLLSNAFTANIPVAVSHGVIGYGGHVGIAKFFRNDPYGNLYVKVFRNPFPFENWNLAEVFAGSGVYYLNQ